MTERKEFLGITENRCDFQGRVIEDPQLFDIEGGQGALLKLKTVVPEADVNGQWVDKIQIVPLYVMDAIKTTKIVIPYIKAGKQLKIGASCKIWDDGTIGLIVTFIKLGDGPFRSKAGEAAPLPG